MLQILQKNGFPAFFLSAIISLMKKIFYRLALFILCSVGISTVCQMQTNGFRLQEILSDIPNNSAWEVDPLTDQQQKEVIQNLNQTFYYLGSGKQSHAFLGEDQKTVLKFFRHNDLSLMKIVKHLSPEKWLWRLIKNYDPRQVFDSCKLAYLDLQDETGISYLHINKTRDQFKPVVLVDNSGVSHTINLDTTEFMVQDYCELATRRIAARMKSKDLEGAKESVKALLASIEDWSRRGILIDNPALKRNIGFCKDKVIMLDVGSLRKESSARTEERIQQEVKRTTRGLARWIYKKYPELYLCFEKELAKP